MLKKWVFSQILLVIILSAVLLTSGCGSSSSSDSAPADTTAPTAPTNVTAVAASDTRVSIRWSASTDNIGVTGYKIYRGGTQIGTATDTVYSDTQCTASATYAYTVAAYDAKGNTSSPSSSTSTTTLAAGTSDSASPTWPPSGSLIATALSSTQISLSWGDATDNVGVSGYNIYRAVTTCDSKVKIGTTSAKSYTDTGLTAVTKYCYAVKAFDGVPNESDASNEKSLTTP